MLYCVVICILLLKLTFQTGIVLVLSIHPGDPTIKEDVKSTGVSKQVNTLDTFLDLIR